jgi:pimeloyl-ACP methyl ester carboxylesterase
MGDGPLFKDLVVVLPGITGSVLSRRENGQDIPVWDLTAGAMWEFLVHQGERIKDLVVPDHDPRVHDPHDAPPDTRVRPTGLMRGFHGIYGLGRIAGYSDLTEVLRRKLDLLPGSPDGDEPANLVEFPYDWRLSCRYNARLLRDVIDRKLRLWREYAGEPGAKVILVCHSMGGLVARYYLEVLGDHDEPGDGQWRKCRALVTFGTPFRGSLNAVDYVANGYKKMFLDLTMVVRSCPSVYEIMPIYAAINQGGGWYRPNEVSIPEASEAYVTAAREFHQEIKAAVKTHQENPDYQDHGYRIFPFVGVGQSTLQSALLEGGVFTAGRIPPPTIGPPLAGGDGTVPRVSAIPIELSEEHRETFLGEQHGFLHSSAPSLDDLVERLKQLQSHGLKEIQGGGKLREAYIDVQVDDLFASGETVVVRSRTVGGPASGTGLTAIVQRTGAGAGTNAAAVYPIVDGTCVLEGLAPGQYKLTLKASTGTAAGPDSVHASFEIAGQGA